MLRKQRSIDRMATQATLQDLRVRQFSRTRGYYPRSVEPTV
jgi:hypothetical protein